MKIVNLCVYKFKSNLKINIFIVLIIVIIVGFIIIKSTTSNIVDEAILIDDDYIILENNEDITKKADKFKNIEKYENKIICLTFDDGPSSYTKLLIDGLKERNVNATFFILGKNISKHPEYIKESYENGNEIGIHGYSHKLFTKLSNEEIENEINLTQNKLFEIIGDSTNNLIRVPYGSLNNRVKETLETLNMQSVLWTIDSKDWKFLNSTKVYNYVLKKVKQNSIILFHDTYKPSVIAALKLVDKLKEEGYIFLTVDEYMEYLIMKNK